MSSDLRDVAIAPVREESLSDEFTDDKDHDIRVKLGIPEGEALLHTYSCALRGKKGFLWQGLLYLFEEHLVFYSKLFGFVHHVLVDLQDMKAALPHAYMKFPTAIKLKYNVDGEEQFMLLASFRNRQSALKRIQEQITRVQRRPMRTKTLTRCFSVAHGENDSFMEPSLSVLSRLRSKRLEPEGAVDHWKDLVEDTRGPSNGMLSFVAESVDSGDDELYTQETDLTDAAVEDPLEVSSEASLPNVWLPQPGSIPPPEDDWNLIYTEVDLPGTTRDFFRYILSDDTNFMVQWWEAKQFKVQEALAWTPNATSSIRQVQFIAPLQEAVGPKETLCIQSQLLTVYADQSLSFETTQNMPHLPIVGGCFNVLMRYDVTDSGMVGGRPTCLLKMYLKVVWKRSGIMINPWKEKVNSKTEAEMKSTWPILAAAMRAYMVAQQSTKVSRAVSLNPDDTVAPLPTPFKLAHAASRSAPASPREITSPPLPALPSAELLAKEEASLLNPPPEASVASSSSRNPTKTSKPASSNGSPVNHSSPNATSGSAQSRRLTGHQPAGSAASGSHMKSPEKHRGVAKSHPSITSRGHTHLTGALNHSPRKVSPRLGGQPLARASLGRKSVQGGEGGEHLHRTDTAYTAVKNEASEEVQGAPSLVAAQPSVPKAAAVEGRDVGQVTYPSWTSVLLQQPLWIVSLLLLLCNMWLLARFAKQQAATTRLMEQLVQKLVDMQSGCPYDGPRQ